MEPKAPDPVEDVPTDASTALAEELAKELEPSATEVAAESEDPQGAEEAKPEEATKKQQESAKRSWTGWLRGSRSARASEDGAQTKEPSPKGAEEESAGDEGKPAGDGKPAETPAEQAGAAGASGLGKWGTWVAQAASTASSAAGRAVANAKTAAGGARNVAGMVYRTGTSVAHDLRKTLANANYNDYHLAVERLEQHAKHMSGEDRQVSLKRWIAVLRELKASKAGAPKARKAEADDDDEADDVAKGLVANAHSVLFFDEEVSPEPMTFRGLFLRSRGLEAIVNNFLLTAPDEKEQKLLVELFNLVLGGTSHQHKAVVAAVVEFSEALANQPTEQVVPKDKINGLILGAIGKLKAKAELEALDAKLAKFEAEVADKLTEDKEARTDDAAAVAALEAVKAASRGLGMLQKRQDLLKAQRSNEEELEEVVEALEAMKAEIRKGKEDVDSQLVDSKLKKLEGDTFRESRLKDVEKELGTVGAEVEALQKRKDDLEAELARVAAALAKARGRETTLKEEREAFEESSTEVVDHLRKAMTKMEALAVGYTFEGAMVVKGLALVDSMLMVDETSRAGAEAAQEAAVEGLERSLARSAVWHANCTLEAVTRVVMTLKDYAMELEAVARSEAAEAAAAGEGSADEAMRRELLGRRHQLEDLYAQAELEGLDVLHQHAVMTSERDFVISVCGGFSTDKAKSVDAELQGLVSRIAERSAEFHALNRPAAQPAPPRSPDQGPAPAGEEGSDKKGADAPEGVVGDGGDDDNDDDDDFDEGWGTTEEPESDEGEKEEQGKGKEDEEDGADVAATELAAASITDKEEEPVADAEGPVEEEEEEEEKPAKEFSADRQETAEGGETPTEGGDEAGSAIPEGAVAEQVASDKNNAPSSTKSKKKKGGKKR